MFTQDRWLLPEGIEEVYPEEAARLERLRRSILDLFACWGYRLVIPPMIEFIDSLLVGTGHDLDLQTFKLIDQLSGRLMGLRADMTPQVARIDARGLHSDLPTRLCYLGTVLHTQTDHLEKSRSPMQVGAELYGHGGSASDLEIIRLMLEMMAIAGLEQVFLDLGHVGIYRSLTRQAGLDEVQEAALFEILQRKDRTELLCFVAERQLPAPVADMLVALVDLNGGDEVLETARQRLAAAGEPVRVALAELETMLAGLRRHFPALPIHFDLAELRGYHYQTGVVFAAFAPGYGREIARGGRYDDIGKAFGRARPATGFSADLKVLARLSGWVEEEGEGGYIFAPALNDADLEDAVRDLRSAGRRVIRELPGQSGGALEMGCADELRKQDGVWRVIPAGGA